MSELSEARKRANKKQDEADKKRKAYIAKRSAAKNFILKLATTEDLELMEEYIAERRKMLEEQKENFLLWDVGGLFKLAEGMWWYQDEGMVARVGMLCDYRSYSMGIDYVVYMALH